MMKDPQEWFNQAYYDFQTAEYMFNGGRYTYTVFMAHLAIEKALKGIYQKKFNEMPPKTHNLVYFINKTEIKFSEDIGKFLIKLDQASVATRYPEDLEKLQSIYTQTTVKEILLKTKEVLEWVKKTF